MTSPDCVIRPLRQSDCPAADALLCELHRLHAEARPDLYRPAMHPYSAEEFRRLGMMPQRSIFEKPLT